MGFTFYWQFRYGYNLTTDDFAQILKLIDKNKLVSKENQEKYKFNYEEEDNSFRLDYYETFLVRIGDNERYHGCKTARHPYSFIIKRILLCMKQIIGDFIEISDDGWDEVEDDLDIIKELNLDKDKITNDPTYNPIKIKNICSRNEFVVAGFIRNINKKYQQRDVVGLIAKFFNLIMIDRDILMNKGEALQLSSISTMYIENTVDVLCDFWEEDVNVNGGRIVMIGGTIINYGKISANNSGYYECNGPGYDGLNVEQLSERDIRSKRKIYGNKQLKELHYGSGTPGLSNRGGGIISIKCDKFINYGDITANGCSYCLGGSVTIIARQFENYGKIEAVGGCFFGPDGRIAIYCDNFVSTKKKKDGRIAIYCENFVSTKEIRPKPYRAFRFMFE